MTKPNAIKTGLIKVRDKALSAIERRLAELNDKLGAIDRKIEDNSRRLDRLERDQFRAKYDSIGVMPVAENIIAAKIFNDLIMYLDPRDIAVVPHIVLERIWESEITAAWLEALDKPDSIVFDIGANFGYYGMLASHRLGKGRGKVVLFEANPNLIPYINKTLSVNWLNENTVVEALGVSDSGGIGELNVLEGYTGSSSMNSIDLLDSYLHEHMKIKAELTLEIPLVTIDDYCRQNKIERIDFMKIDIEGYEEKAYQGMKTMVKKSPDMVLFIEFTKFAYEQPEKFYKQLIADFGNVYTINEEGELIAPRDNSYEALIQKAELIQFLVVSKKPIKHKKEAKQR